MSLDLLIIHPGAAHGIYGSDLANSLVAKEPPLWARLISGYVRDRGFSVKIIDAEAENLSPKDVAYRALHEEPRLVCLCVFGHQPSASTQQMVGAGETARWIKRIARQMNEDGVVPIHDPPIIMVGGHVAALPIQTLKEEQIDYACNGEGPATIVSLLAMLSVGMDMPEDVPGLVWWNEENMEPISNPSAKLLDVNDLHGDAWDLLPMHLYRAHNWQCFGDLGARQPYASIYTSLGCPYKCSFCCINAPFQTAGAPGGGNRYRMRKPEDVVNEIVALWARFGVKTIKIIDELFILNPKHYVEICERIIDRMDWEILPRDLNIWAYARIDTVKEGHLDLLRRAGIRWLALGIESASAFVRDGAAKAMKNDDIEGVCRAIRAADINIIGNYIFGLPDDDARSMQATLDLACDLNTEFANFYSAMAYPGSPLYTQAVAAGAHLPATWSGYSQHNSDCRPLDTQHVSAKEVLAFRDAAFTTYFTNPTYLEMVEAKFGKDTLAHVRDMTKFKLTRKLLTGEIE
jgi:anaerobic magnesium-protoporphyrin IX monomethyl ester cyclase